eukprot:13425588-Alexandrium_andersonii.AAC.1
MTCARSRPGWRRASCARSRAGLGDGKSDLEEARLLNRVIRWTPSGYLYEADSRHAEQLVRGLLSA